VPLAARFRSERPRGSRHVSATLRSAGRDAARNPRTCTCGRPRFIWQPECVPHRCWTTEELYADLERFRAELIAAGKADHTVQTYVDRAQRYIRWLDGKYDPEAR
jgi:hypothetical protein